MGKIYVCSDLHGMYNLYQQIDACTNPDDTIIFLGDAADRGPMGWEIIKAIAKNPKWIWLQGNHDAMLAAAMREIDALGRPGDECRLLFNNGGRMTLQSWQMDSSDLRWARFLESLPKYKEVRKNGKIFCLSHAGFTPTFNKNGTFLPPDEELLWNREHPFDSFWPAGYEDYIIIHGHTPIYYLTHEDVEYIYKYHNGQKIGIDNGCFYTKAIGLLDLDTLEVLKFQSL